MSEPEQVDFKPKWFNDKELCDLCDNDNWMIGPSKEQTEQEEIEEIERLINEQQQLLREWANGMEL